VLSREDEGKKSASQYMKKWQPANLQICRFSVLGDRLLSEMLPAVLSSSQFDKMNLVIFIYLFIYFYEGCDLNLGVVLVAQCLGKLNTIRHKSGIQKSAATF